MAIKDWGSDAKFGLMWLLISIGAASVILAIGFVTWLLGYNPFAG